MFLRKSLIKISWPWVVFHFELIFYLMGWAVRKCQMSSLRVHNTPSLFKILWKFNQTVFIITLRFFIILFHFSTFFFFWNCFKEPDQLTLQKSINFLSNWVLFALRNLLIFCEFIKSNCWSNFDLDKIKYGLIN